MSVCADTLAGDNESISEEEQVNDEAIEEMVGGSVRTPKSTTTAAAQQEDKDYMSDMDDEIEDLPEASESLRQELDSIHVVPASAVTSSCHSSASSSSSSLNGEIGEGGTENHHDSIQNNDDADSTVDNNVVRRGDVESTSSCPLETPTGTGDIVTSSDEGKAQNDVPQEQLQKTQAEEEFFVPMKDTFSLMFVCKICSQGFAYSLFFCALQFITLTLISINILKNAPDGNPLNVPVATSLDVVLAQALCLFISLITQSDFVATFDLVNVKYNKTVLQKFKGATHTKWIFSNMCRFLVGLFSVGMSFVIIVQSTTVLEIFFKFAAVNFVSELDNKGFNLAKKGFMPMGDLEKIAKKLDEPKKCAEVKFEQEKRVVLFPGTKISIPATWLRLAIFSVHMVILYGGWFFIRYRQATGQYLQSYLESGCESFEVRFSGELTNRCKQASCFGFYGAFSDFYDIFRDASDSTISTNGVRPVYYQRDFDKGFGENKYKEGKESSPGKFSYCQSEEAWVFTVDTVTKDKKDECNWLLRSPKTEAYSLRDAPTTGWSMWLNHVLVPADALFEISCRRECENDVDCNFHGTCEKKECICEYPWTGRSCQTWACSPLLSYSIDVEEGKNTDPIPSDDFLHLENITYNDRPVYYHNDTQKNKTEVVFYSYGRFNVGTFDIDPDKHNYTKELHDYFQEFHDWWKYDYYGSWEHTFVSEYTTAAMPTSGFESIEEVTWRHDWPTLGKSIMFACEKPYNYEDEVNRSEL